MYKLNKRNDMKKLILIVLLSALCFADRPNKEDLNRCAEAQSIVNADVDMATWAFNFQDARTGLEYLKMAIAKQKLYISSCECVLNHTSRTHIAKQNLYRYQKMVRFIEVKAGIKDE